MEKPASQVGADVSRSAGAGTRGRLPELRAAVLIGFMGAGKSSVGRALSEQVGWGFEDLDERIERFEKRKVAEIFRKSGEAAFRKAEHAALKELLAEVESGEKKIVALGGGAFAQGKNTEILAKAGVVTIFLDAEPEELWKRCRGQENVERPLLGSLTGFRELYAARRPDYLKARLRQATTGKTIAEVVEELMDVLGLKRSGGMRGET
jgi:shikimate kinase